MWSINRVWVLGGQGSGTYLWMKASPGHRARFSLFPSTSYLLPLDWGRLEGRPGLRMHCHAPGAQHVSGTQFPLSTQEFLNLSCRALSLPRFRAPGTYSSAGELLISGTEKRWPARVSDIGDGKGGVPTWCRASALLVCFCRLLWAAARFFSFFLSCL